MADCVLINIHEPVLGAESKSHSYLSLCVPKSGSGHNTTHYSTCHEHRLIYDKVRHIYPLVGFYNPTVGCSRSSARSITESHVVFSVRIGKITLETSALFPSYPLPSFMLSSVLILQAELKDEAEKPSESAEKSDKTEAVDKVKKEGSEREEESEEGGDAKTTPAGHGEIYDAIQEHVA